MTALTSRGIEPWALPPRNTDWVLRDAVAVQESGAFSIVLEGIAAVLGKRISRELDIPTIGGVDPRRPGTLL